MGQRLLFTRWTIYTQAIFVIPAPLDPRILPITSCAHQTSPRWRPPFLSDLRRRRSPLPTPPPGRSTRPTLRRTPSSPVHRGRRATTSARQVSVLDSPPSREGALERRCCHDPLPPSFRQEVALGPLDGGRRIFGCREVKMTVVRAVAPRRRIYLRARLSHESLSTFNFLRPQAFVERGVARFTRHEGETTVDLRRESSEAEFNRAKRREMMCGGIESGDWG